MRISRREFTIGAASLAVPAELVSVPAQAQTPGPAGQAPLYPDAAASDPVALGWMQGTPPPPERQIRFEDGSFLRFPQQRWTFSHWRQFRPTVKIARGGPVTVLPRAERADLDAVSFTPIGAATTMTWRESLSANYTDGIVVLHRGRIVYERYLGALRPDGEHIAFSVSKSLFGTIGAMLVGEGKLDRDAAVVRTIPELAGSGFADATVGQVLDMTTALNFTEDYIGTSGDFAAYRLARGTAPLPAGYDGPNSAYEFDRRIAKNGEHGRAFVYRSPNADILGWLISRVEAKPLDQVVSERIWSRIGAEADACFHVDPSGVPHAASGLNCCLRDLARFGEMMRGNGRINGRQVVPAAVVERIRKGGDPARFAGYATLPGWSYGNQWWHAHDDHGVYMARGTYGQAIYIDPAAEMVIARFASHPLAGNVNLDPTSLPAYRAVAEHLTTARR
ncbi:MAG: 6-aminohexanoate-dimer hydrolase [Sphingomonas bacterium]|uniref:serine hydrolase domain-containing protein n=1 Tax=Sphingomonas bacterium TaxID=1895847 RepID=UPI002636A53A|nr:serine hydrolase [Sphingomonas bacterium]MDB5704450.1 6-aminohexanoate-dimer hydrolase [Sphingomonas bacterium]